MKSNFGGIVPAIASPCDENDVFLPETFAALAERLYQEGVHGLYVCGITGDGYKMRLAERKQAAEIAVKASAEYDGKTIVHVGSQSNSRDAIELAQHAAKAGAEAVASIPPAFCSQEKLVEYYADIAKASELPLFVYHIPMLTGRNTSVDEMVELLDIPGVVGLKFSDWNLFFMKQLLLARPDIVVFNGLDEILTAGLLYGAHGGIGMWYNLFPKLDLGIYQAVSDGHVARAMELQGRLLAFCDLALKTTGFHPVFEHLMRERGIGPRCFRRPRGKLDAGIPESLVAELNKRVAAIEDICKE